jgi:hypothetical protein
MADMKTSTVATAATTAPSPSLPRGQLVVGGDVMPPLMLLFGLVWAAGNRQREMGSGGRW